MIVLDASVAILGLLNNGDSRKALQKETIAIPHLADIEIAHVLRTKVLKQEITETIGNDALRVWTQLGMMRYSATPLLNRVWLLRNNMTAYDANYVALAELLDCELITADAKLAGAPGAQCSIKVVRS